jgi:glycosyltransferase involved in cell wall biosynthesis
MNRPLLSICIPTYNREHYLKECLDSITCQFKDEDIRRQVEIVVFDNASDDNTAGMILDYQSRFDNIFYFRNESNLGYDRNVEKVVYQAKGDFIWTLSSDELVKPDALSFLFSVFTHHPDIAWVCIDNGDEQKDDIEEYTDGSDWLKYSNLAGGQLSQNIYNRKYLPANIEKYFDNLWIHYSLAREIAAKRPQLAVKNLFKVPEVEHPCDWAGGGKALVTYIKLKQIIDGLPAFGYDKEVIASIRRSLAKGLLRQVASAKIHGLNVDFNNFKLIVDNFYSFPVSLVVALAVFFSPSWILHRLKSYV